MVGLHRPIFVLALKGRSGTNYLRDLISAHPDVFRSDIPEDFLMMRAGQLTDYADRLLREWQSHTWYERFDLEAYTADNLLERLGWAMLQFVGETDRPGRMILKTPYLGDLSAALRLFPSGKMLILLRDPRSIVESTMRSHWYNGASLEEQGSAWARSARYLENFLRDHQEAVRNGRIRLVRYEKLVRQPRQELTQLLDFLELSQDDHAISRADQSPVIGSSFLARTSSGDVDFRPVERPPNFDPVCRWSHWTPAQHRRFNRVCGAMMERWGYPMVTEGENERN